MRINSFSRVGAASGPPPNSVIWLSFENKEGCVALVVSTSGY